MTPSAGTLPPGHILIEPHVYDVTAPSRNGLGSQSYVIYGLMNRLSVGLIPVFGYNVVSGGPNSTRVRVGDFTAVAQYRSRPLLEGVLQDAHLALRLLRRSPRLHAHHGVDACPRDRIRDHDLHARERDPPAAAPGSTVSFDPPTTSFNMPSLWTPRGSDANTMAWRRSSNVSSRMATPVVAGDLIPVREGAVDGAVRLKSPTPKSSALDAAVVWARLPGRFRNGDQILYELMGAGAPLRSMADNSRLPRDRVKVVLRAAEAPGKVIGIRVGTLLFPLLAELAGQPLVLVPLNGEPSVRRIVVVVRVGASAADAVAGLLTACQLPVSGA